VTAAVVVARGRDETVLPHLLVATATQKPAACGLQGSAVDREAMSRACQSPFANVKGVDNPSLRQAGISPSNHICLS
jgi:hypothetical protein